METNEKTNGRGLRPILEPVSDTEHSEAARAAYQQVAHIFDFVMAIRKTASGESVGELADGLQRLERERRERESGRRGWFGRG